MESGASLAQRLSRIREEIQEAAAESDRDAGDITLIVVTKFHPTSLITDLYDLGVRNVGENRHQEAEMKSRELAHVADLKWHFIGQLQSNKARAVRTYADVLHSVDRASLVDALVSGDPSSRKHERLDCFVQMNLTSDGGRGGASDESDMLALADRVSSEESLNLLGIMAVAPLDEEPASAFARVHAASERLAQVHPAARSISMGMSHDFRQAIAHGATHLRIGTAITGSRPIQG